MNDNDRVSKLHIVLDQLPIADQFSFEDATLVCPDLSKRFVRETLKQLVHDGYLAEYNQLDASHYQWRKRLDVALAATWVEHQVHGSQITQMPENERPREKLQRDGANELSTAELLAILIRVGIRGESAIESGRILANFFASKMPELRKKSLLELKTISRAISKANYAQIMAGIELGRRVANAELQQQVESVRITSSDIAIRYCLDEFHVLAHDGMQEEFHIVTLDTKYKPIRTHCITVGTLDASLVHPREVFRPAIRDAASAVILVHNHPSGDPTPSREDRQVTERLTEAGKLIGIDVLDHIVVASRGGVSIKA